MHANHIYNLMNQLVQENKSLWRIKHWYFKEAQDDEEKRFWKKMEKDKENHVKELAELIKKNL